MRVDHGLAALLSACVFATGAFAHASLVSTDPARRQRGRAGAEDGAIAFQRDR